MIWQTIQKPNSFGNGLPGLNPPQEVGVYFDERTVGRILRGNWMAPIVCTMLLAVALVVWRYWDTMPTTKQEADRRPDFIVQEAQLLTAALRKELINGQKDYRQEIADPTISRDP